MAMTFTDEDLMYLDKERDEQLRSIRLFINELKVKDGQEFCKKCGHLMQHYMVGNAKLFQCGFCGNRVAEVIKL